MSLIGDCCSSHTTKREEIMLNSNMPSREKIELLWSKYLVRTPLPQNVNSRDTHRKKAFFTSLWSLIISPAVL